jgi:glycolate oxidase iron-sulfur subunit
VHYGELIRAARAVIRDREPGLLRAGWRERAARRLLSPERGASWRSGVRLAQRIGLRRFARATGIMKLLDVESLDAELPALAAEFVWRPLYPATAPRRGAVALFTGCGSHVADRPALDAAIRVLTHLGYDVHVPRGQTCCGALAQHGGNASDAELLAMRNIAAFDIPESETTVAVASGCTATLHEYGRVFEHPAAHSFSSRVRDITSFLADLLASQPLPLRPLSARIAVHDSCTSTNVLRNQDKTYALLRRIPRAVVTPIPDNQFCCGSAGVYHLRQPTLASTLRADKIEHIRKLAPDIVVSANVGCALFLSGGLREAGLDIEVVHPVVLLARQLQD